MRKQLLAFVISLLCVVSSWGEKNKLNVFIWSEYIDPAIVTGFAKQFDCKLTVDLYEDNESMLAKLQGGGASLYDIIVPSDYIVTVLINLKLVAPLRHENIPNIKNLDPKFANLGIDPGNKYTAPYQWGTVGLYMRKDKDKPIEETWALIFDAKKQPGPFLLIDDVRGCFAAALKYKGHSINTVSKPELLEAYTLLLEAKGRSLGFEGGVGGKNRVLAKGCKMAMVYNGDAVRGMNDDAETHYFVPKEGGEIWLDNMAVPAKAPNRDMAEKFINYILDAKVGARLSNFNRCATPNAAAKQFIRPEDLQNTAIYPSEEMMNKMEFIKDLGSNTRLYDALWTKLKSN